MHTKTQMTLNPVQGPKLKETPFFGPFLTRFTPLCTASMTFPRISLNWHHYSPPALCVSSISRNRYPLSCAQHYHNYEHTENYVIVFKCCKSS